MASNKVFIDTGAFFARFFSRDRFNEEANILWEELENQSCELVTTGYVLSEFATLLARKTDYAYAAQILPLVHNPEVFTIIRGNRIDERSAMGYFKKYADQKIGFADCISFAVMQRLEIKRAFTFDKHFEMAGFEMAPALYS